LRRATVREHSIFSVRHRIDNLQKTNGVGDVRDLSSMISRSVRVKARSVTSLRRSELAVVCQANRDPSHPPQGDLSLRARIRPGLEGKFRLRQRESYGSGSRIIRLVYISVFRHRRDFSAHQSSSGLSLIASKRADHDVTYHFA
jgi:hypothetical protein